MAMEPKYQLSVLSLFFLLAVSVIEKTDCYKPVVLIHGFMAGDDELKPIIEYIQKTHPGTNVTFLSILTKGWSVLPMWEQVRRFGAEFNKIAEANPKGLHLIGYSQGGLIARGVLETLPKHNVHTFISLASPQMGVYGAPESADLVLRMLSKLTKKIAYTSYGQFMSVPNYWRDPENRQEYLEKSNFLPFLNNEIDHPHNEEFKKNFLKIKRMVLIGGTDDNVIRPWQSSIFGFYDEKLQMIAMREQKIYAMDTFGLKSLDKRKGIHVHVSSNVTHYDWWHKPELFHKYIEPYLT